MKNKLLRRRKRSTWEERMYGSPDKHSRGAKLLRANRNRGLGRNTGRR